jgi:hypothetical protein
MGKRVADSNTMLIEPGEVRAKKVRIATQNSAALTLLLLRSEEPCVTTQDAKVAMPSQHASSVTDDEDDAQDVKGVTVRRMPVVPSPMAPLRLFTGFRNPSLLLSAPSPSRAKDRIFVGKPLSAPPVLGVPPASMTSMLQPLSSQL